MHCHWPSEALLLRKATSMTQLFAGTSGFAYPSWKPDFYPSDLSARHFLLFYAKHLNSVEINYTFRRLPADTTLENWIRSTPPGFVFALKGHQRITHILRLKEAAKSTEMFLNSITPLKTARRLGPILFQLPPQLRCDLAVLGAFLDQLQSGFRYAFEFRHDSWFCMPVYRLLEKHKIALCLAESETFHVPQVVTSDFVYCRLRKPDYRPKDRRTIAAKVKKLLDEGRDVFVFFKHEENPAGALYAEELLQETRSNYRGL
jgi:uncharacterized protein YecE (DUF72 family)